MPIKLSCLLLSLLFTSCGGLSFFSDKNVQTERVIASITLNNLLNEENPSFASEIDDKLLSLHSYYVIGHKKLKSFDHALIELPLEDLYQTSAYMALIAVHTQTDEIEKELMSLMEASAQKGLDSKEKILLERIALFKKRSFLAELSMMNLSDEVPSRDVTDRDLEIEISELETSKEFMIYEKNIEHLSHLMEVNHKVVTKKFKPSENVMGNLTGQEFPAKVWALTFDKGPEPKNTPIILKNLKDKNLKATFFQTTSQVKKHFRIGQTIRDAGMEIGSHSYSHKELTKVGEMTLEKEIADATETLEKDLQIEVDFFRLPFGSGVSVPTIRRTIANNNLIHAHWNVDTLDWMTQTPDRIIERTKRLMKKTPRDAGVIVFHDTHRRSVIASNEIMAHLKKNGRRACTLGRIIKEINEDSKTVCLEKSHLSF